MAVAKGGKTVWEEGFGLTSFKSGAPVTPDTMFPAASITKGLTATGLMILVERGKVDPDRPANDYLGPAGLRSVVEGSPAPTIRNLIFMTAGLPMHWHMYYTDRPERAPDMDESIRRYGLLAMVPGEEYQYSNFGYGILGHVIARVSGQSYPDFMAQEVFAPLGMTRTAILGDPPALRDVAAKFDEGRRELPFCGFDHPGASAAYVSARDLLRFGLFHLGSGWPGAKPPLSKATLSAMHTRSESSTLDSGLPVKMLLGCFAQIDYQGVRFMSVTGGMPGAVSRLDLIPAEGLASVILANAGNADLWTLQQAIFGAFVPALRDAPPLPDAGKEAGTAAPFVVPEDLIGRWSGKVRVEDKNLAAALSFRKGSDPQLEIDGKTTSPLSVRTELGPMTCKDGIFSGLFWGTIKTPDTTGRAHVVFVRVKLRGNKLTGTLSAVSTDARRNFCLPHAVVLVRE